MENLAESQPNIDSGERSRSLRIGLLVVAGLLAVTTLAACTRKEQATTSRAIETPRIVQVETAAPELAISAASSSGFEVPEFQQEVYYHFRNGKVLDESKPQYVYEGIRFYWVDEAIVQSKVEPILQEISRYVLEAVNGVGYSTHQDGISIVFDQSERGAAGVTKAAYFSERAEGKCGGRPYYVIDTQLILDGDLDDLERTVRHEVGSHGMVITLMNDYAYSPIEESLGIAVGLTGDEVTSSWDIAGFTEYHFSVWVGGYVRNILGRGVYGAYGFPIFLGSYYEVDTDQLIGQIIKERAARYCQDPPLSQDQRLKLINQVSEVGDVISEQTGGLSTEELLALWLASLLPNFDTSLTTYGDLDYSFYQSLYMPEVMRMWEVISGTEGVYVVKDNHGEDDNAHLVLIEVADGSVITVIYDPTDYIIAANVNGVPTLLSPGSYPVDGMDFSGNIPIVVVYPNPEMLANTPITVSVE